MSFYKDLANKTKAVATTQSKDKEKKSEPRGSVAAFIDVIGDLKEAESKVKSLESENEQLKANHQKSLTVKIDSLVASPFQTRKLDLVRVTELKEHLACNKLATPISVRASSLHPGKFEILSGHHRVEAFKELGRTEIEAIIQMMDDQEAQELIFYDNLMAPDLPDFEKYKGFAAIQKRTGQSYRELAENAGIHKSAVGHYFSFEKLPEKAKKLLEEYPHLIGSAAAQKISTLKANEDKIVTGLQKIIAGELDQKRIIAFLKHDQSLKSESQHIASVIKQGEKTVCTLSTKNDKSITLTFEKGFKAQDWHQRLVAFIEKESDSSVN